MRARLPPLNALRAFALSGRHLSFSQAAAALHVTPAAVGQQVRALENQLGAALFVRRGRRLELTEAGQSLLPGVTSAFDQLGLALDAFYRRARRRPLTVSVEPSFAAKWLLGRLDHFREQHPGIEIRLDATTRLVDFARDGIDLAIRYGSGEYPGLRVDRLLEEQVFPVCSPRLASGSRALREPADLGSHTLLHSDWDPDNPTWPDWEMWLQAAGVEGIDASAGPQFAGPEGYTLMLEAAVAGQGVALSSSVLAGDDLRAGRLVRPFVLSMPQPLGYYVVCLTAIADTSPAATFRDWLLGEASAWAETQ